MFIQEAYQCIDCSYTDTAYHTFTECYFCNELICNECTLENKANACNNCSFNSNSVYFENNGLVINCLLCKTDVFIQYDDQKYCNICNYIVCNNCNTSSNKSSNIDSNDTICVNCNENEIYNKLINLNLN